MKGLGIRTFLKYRMLYPWQAAGKQKIFCIGRNKTGTTSLAAEFKELGFPVGHQRTAEKLIDYYIAKDFQPIIDYCRSAQVFQDAPFSWPDTYRYLDAAYPGSLFILSIRDNAEQWYRSLTKFHSKLFGKGNIPTAQHLREAQYIHQGFMWKANRAVFNTPEHDPYNKEMLLEHYDTYNREVVDYFKDRNNLLVLNLQDRDAYGKFCKFIGIPQQKETFPWKNKTEEHSVRK